MGLTVADETLRRLITEDPAFQSAGQFDRARFEQLLAGQRIHHGGRIDVAARYVEPTIVLDPPADSALMQEEIFGPVLPVIAGWCFLAGTLLFSGSLYLLAITNRRALGAITPIGGLTLLIGWALIFAATVRALSVVP